MLPKRERERERERKREREREKKKRKRKRKKNYIQFSTVPIIIEGTDFPQASYL